MSTPVANIKTPDPYESLLDSYQAKPLPATNYDPLIEKHAAANGLDPDLLRAVMHQESRGRRRAVSPVGAQGLMQLMPATASRFGVTDPADADQNIGGGAKYLKFLLKRFNGNVDLALAGYNAGEGAVDKFGGIPPYKETRNYVKTIKANYGGSGFAQQPQDQYESLLNDIEKKAKPPAPSDDYEKLLDSFDSPAAATPPNQGEVTSGSPTIPSRGTTQSPATFKGVKGGARGSSTLSRRGVPRVSNPNVNLDELPVYDTSTGQMLPSKKEQAAQTAQVLGGAVMRGGAEGSASVQPGADVAGRGNRVYITGQRPSVLNTPEPQKPLSQVEQTEAEQLGRGGANFATLADAARAPAAYPATQGGIEFLGKLLTQGAGVARTEQDLIDLLPKEYADKISSIASHATGLSPGQFADLLSSRARVMQAATQEADRLHPMTNAQKVVHFGEGLAGDLAEMILLSEAAGPYAAFGGSSYVSARGQGQSVGRSAVEGGKGLATAGLFNATEAKPLLERLPSVAVGSYAMERATGASPEEARRTALMNTLFSGAHDAVGVGSKALDFASGPQGFIQRNYIEQPLRSGQPTDTVAPPVNVKARVSPAEPSGGRPVEEGGAEVSGVSMNPPETETPPQHHELQPRRQRKVSTGTPGQFKKETATQREARRAQVGGEYTAGQRLPKEYVYHNTTPEAVGAIEREGLSAGVFSDKPVDFNGRPVWLAVKKTDLPNVESHDYGGVMTHETAFDAYPERGIEASAPVPPEKIYLVDKQGRVIRRLGQSTFEQTIARDPSRFGVEGEQVPSEEEALTTFKGEYEAERNSLAQDEARLTTERLDEVSRRNLTRDISNSKVRLSEMADQAEELFGERAKEITGEEKAGEVTARQVPEGTPGEVSHVPSESEAGAGKATRPTKIGSAFWEDVPGGRVATTTRRPSETFALEAEVEKSGALQRLYEQGAISSPDVVGLRRAAAKRFQGNMVAIENAYHQALLKLSSTDVKSTARSTTFLPESVGGTPVKGEEGAREKQPHEMTREEIKARGRRLANEKEPWEMSRNEFDVYSRADFYPDMGVHSGNEILAQYDKYGRVDGERRWVIERALEQGKTVPPEVLADYPDLSVSTTRAEVAPPQVQERAKVEKPTSVRGSRVERPNPRTGLTKPQTDYLAGELEKVADKAIGEASGEGAMQPREMREHFAKEGGLPKSFLSTPMEKSVTIKVPDDGEFTIRSGQAANKLHQKITGKPIEGFERAEGTGLHPTRASVRSVTSETPASLNDYVKSIGGEQQALGVFKRLSTQLASDPQAEESLGFTQHDIDRLTEGVRRKLDEKRNVEPVRDKYLAEVNRKIESAPSFDKLRQAVLDYKLKRAGRGKVRRDAATSDVADMTPEMLLAYEPAVQDKVAKRDIASAKAGVRHEADIPYNYTRGDVDWLAYERRAIGDDAADAKYFARGRAGEAGKLDISFLSPVAKGIRRVLGIKEPEPIEPSFRLRGKREQSENVRAAERALGKPAREGNDISVPPTERARGVSDVGARTLAASDVARGQETIRRGRGEQAGATPDVEGRTAPGVSETRATRSFPKSAEEAGLSRGTNLTYEVVGDKPSVDRANKRIDSQGADRVAADIARSSEPTKDDIVAGQILARKYSESGDHEREVAVINDLAEKLTRAGQTVQAASLIDHLSPEGSLIYGQRILNKRGANRTLTEDEATAIKEGAQRVREASAKVANPDKDLEAKASDLERQLEEMRAEARSNKGVEKVINEERTQARRVRRAETKQQLDTEFADLKTQFAKARAKVKDVQPSGLAGLDPEGELTGLMLEMAKNRVRAGVNTVEGLVDEVYNALKEHGLSKRDVRDAISGYGKTAEMSQEPDAVKLRELKRQMRLVSSLEDAQAGQRPLRSGLQRDVQSDVVKDLQRQVNQVMKEKGIRQPRRASEQRDALDALKTRLRNEIGALDRGEVKAKPTPVVRDTEADALKAERDLLKRRLENPTEKNKERLKARIAETERQLREKDFERKGYPSKIYDDAQTVTLRGRLKELNKQKPTPLIKEIAVRAKGDATLYAGASKIASRPDITSRVWASEMASEFNLRGKDLQKAFRDSYQLYKDANTSLRRGGRTQAELDAQTELRQARQELSRTYESLGRSPLRRGLDSALNTLGLSRALTTLAPFHAAFKHAKAAIVPHPIVFAKAFVKQVEALNSAQYERFVSEVQLDPKYRYAQKFGVGLTGDFGGRTDLAGMEEATQSNWIHKIPGIKHSGQAFNTMVNVTRFGWFKEYMKYCEKLGYNPDNPAHAHVFRQGAELVNNATGRGSLPGTLDKATPALNNAFFSTRLWASRLKMISLPFDLRSYLPERAGGLSRPAKVESWKTLFGFTGLVGLQMYLAHLAGAQVSFNRDDDNFLQARWGRFHWDATAGMGTNIKYALKLEEAIRGNEKQKFGDILQNYVVNHLAPIPSGLYDIAQGKDRGGRPVYAWGRPGSGAVGRVRSSRVAGMFWPMSFEDAKTGYEQSGLGEDILSGLGKAFGEGTEVYAPRSQGGDSFSRPTQPNRKEQ